MNIATKTGAGSCRLALFGRAFCLLAAGGCGAEPHVSVTSSEASTAQASTADSAQAKALADHAPATAATAATFASVGLSADKKKIADDFHLLYYGSPQSTYLTTRWMGVPVLKVPFDLWVYQELIQRIRPDVVVETGTFCGGSALFMAQVMDRLGAGEVVTVDLWDDLEATQNIDHMFPQLADRGQFRPKHPRIHYIHGSSTSQEAKEAVAARIGPASRVLVVLDSDHYKHHVAQEISFYKDLVSVGSYLIVEDTNLNGHPVEPGFGDGPMEAVVDFLQSTDDFVVDHDLEKYFFTLNPSGFLRRVK